MTLLRLKSVLWQNAYLLSVQVSSILVLCSSSFTSKLRTKSARTYHESSAVYSLGLCLNATLLKKKRRDQNGCFSLFQLTFSGQTKLAIENSILVFCRFSLVSTNICVSI